jgi:enamine deaminase RidA (YjgF/YER057c/UK114 family)
MDGRVEFLNPDGLPRNPAFSNVAVVSGSVRTIYIGGQDAVDAEGNIVGIGDIAAQTEQVLRNLRTALAAAGARTSPPATRRSSECGATDPIRRSSRPPSSRA